MKYEISAADKIVILGTDGLWEFIPNQEALRIVVPFYASNDVEGASEALLQEAHQRWQKDSQVIDDITIIVVFLL